MKGEVRDHTTGVKVSWNEAKIEVQGRTIAIKEAHGWTWERGKPVPEPVPLDMAREVWR